MSKDYYGLSTRVLENDAVRAEFLTTAGPRIVRLTLHGSENNILAELPGLKWETPYGEGSMWGGHRLWHAPEAFPRTYVPDGEGLVVEDTPYGVRLVGPVEAPTGIRKSLEISLLPDQPGLSIKHILFNDNLWPVELAPWGITQMPLGGTAILPQPVVPQDQDALLPNRQLVLWPYTRWSDPRLVLADDLILVKGESNLPPIKIGTMNYQGWIAYANNTVLFCKRFETQPDQPHVDFGCNTECYCNHLFIELESVGPLAKLEPGEFAEHTETWELYPDVETPATLDDAREILSRLPL